MQMFEYATKGISFLTGGKSSIWRVLLLLGLASDVLHAQSRDLITGVKISLPAQVEVRQSAVHLGDIASLVTYDVATLRRLMSLPLGQAPRAGRSVVLEREVLARWIRVHTGLQDGQITWQGAATAEVSIRSRDISGDEITRVAERALQAQLTIQQPFGARIELQANTVPRDMVVPDDAIEFKARALGATPLAPRMTVWIDVLASGRGLRSVPVVFDVAVYTPVVVAIRNLPSGAFLTSDNLLVREQNIVSAPSPRFDQLQSLTGGQRVRRPLRSGEIVTASHTESTPDVVRGSWAILESHQTGVNVQSRAEVLQDGRAGQMIQVKPSNSSASLLARVTGPGRVEMFP